MTVDIPLVLRIPKTSPLTALELDNNFVNLRIGIQTVAAAMGYRIAVGAEPPIGDRPDTIWIPNGPSGAYIWDAVNGKWVPIEANRYAVATAVGNAYSVTIPGSYASLADLTGRIIAAKIPSANTGAATLAVNAFAAVAIKKYGTVDLEDGDMPAATVALFLYDGAQFNIISNVAPRPLAASEVYGVITVLGPITVPAMGSATPIPHTLGRTPVILNTVLVCQEEGHAGCSLNDEVDIHATDITDTNGRWSMFSVIGSATNVHVARSNKDADTSHHFILGKNGSGATLFDPTKWRIKSYIL